MATITHEIDLQLTRKAIRDSRVLSEVAEKLYPKVYQTVYLLVGSHPDAGDVAQMCLLKIIENLKKYRGEGPLAAWAGRLTYRVTMRQMKRIRTDYRTVTPVANDRADKLKQDTSVHGDEFSRTRLRRWLAGHLAKLPSKRREVVVLHHVYGYTMEEIGEIMHVSPNTIKSRLLQAIKDLRASVLCDGAATANMFEDFND